MAAVSWAEPEPDPKADPAPDSDPGTHKGPNPKPEGQFINWPQRPPASQV